MSFDHVAIYVPASKFEDEIRFYNTALAGLNMKEQMRPVDLVVAIGDNPHKQPFWVSARGKDGPIQDDGAGANAGHGHGTHIAFKAKDQAQVDEFHKAGLTAGGTDNGPPGIRSDYHPGYYAAFLISPGGHNIEMVFHDFSWMAKQ